MPHRTTRDNSSDLHKLGESTVVEDTRNGCVVLWPGPRSCYHNMRFYVSQTKEYRTTASFDLYPQHCMLPTFTLTQHAIEIGTELIKSIKKLKPWAIKDILIEKYRIKPTEAIFLARFLEKCLKWNPKDRASAQDLLSDPWIKM